MSRKRPREESVGAVPPKSPRRAASVFDAVAGRVGYESFLTADRASRYRDTKSNSGQAVPAEEVLFRRKGAPRRYEENDVYFANEKLPAGQKLPDSDLVKYVHTYASDFYQRATESKGKRDWKSMDETALLALAILMEEAAAESLGRTGDLALVESSHADAGATRPLYWNGQQWRESVLQKKRVDRRSRRAPSKSRPVDLDREGSGESEDIDEG